MLQMERQGSFMTKTSLKLCAAAVLALAAATSQAAIVADGNFAEGASAGGFTTVYGGGSIGAWTVTGDSVDLIGNYWQQAPGGSYTVDLDGSGVGGVSQSLAGLSDGSYYLSFYLSGNPDGGAPTKSVLVSAGDASQAFDFTTGSNSRGDMAYVHETLKFDVTGGSTTLSFASQDVSSYWGPVIGNVSISAVPESGPLPMLAAGLGVLALVARRRRA
jgi:choice-of-anchor C domain-containing protein